jgi:hypothetical protein
MYIGKIVSASSHIDYVCQIYGPGETERAPQPADYGLGAFVAIEQAEGGHLVGMICNTTLLNPEFGNLGPRLSTQAELTVFSPDYLAEKVTLVALVVVGAVAAGGAVHQGVPIVAASLDSRVRPLTRDEIVAFHKLGGGLQLAYLPMLATMLNPLAPHIMAQLIAYLGELFPKEAKRLTLLANNLAWRSRVEPLR